MQGRSGSLELPVRIGPRGKAWGDSAFTTGNRDAVDQAGKVEVARVEQRKISIEVADGKERTTFICKPDARSRGKKARPDFCRHQDHARM